MQFTLYALPAMVALLAKAGMFVYARYSKVHNLQTRLYLLFLFALSIQDLTEIHLFVTNARELANPPGTSGTVYFSVSILAIAFLLHLALIMAKKWDGKQNNLPPTDMALVYAPAVFLQTLLWSTPLLVTGFEPMGGYTYVRIPGPLYFVFQSYAVGYVCAAAGLLFYASQNQITPFQRLQNKLLLVSLFPIVILVPTIIILQHLGFRGLNSTVTLPIAVTFFLAVTAYVTHQHRLFDIEFFLPWSKVRKRKTAFYNRIKSLIAEIAGMNSVNKIVQSLSDVLHCPVALIGGPRPALAMAGEAFGIARFPLEELSKIDQIVVANEIANAMPATHALMKRHKVAAIVPFNPHSQAAASWMLLGEAFSEQVYSPLDFKTVETLFARLADHFLDNQLLLRSQLAQAQREMEVLHGRLANAWEEIESLRRQLSETKAENRQIRRHGAETPDRNPATIPENTLEGPEGEQKSFDQHVAEYEAHLIAKTLEHCSGDVSRAAKLLCLSIETLHDKLRQIRSSGNDPAEPEVLFV